MNRYGTARSNARIVLGASFDQSQRLRIVDHDELRVQSQALRLRRLYSTKIS
jgi:hypothetical protein